MSNRISFSIRTVPISKRSCLASFQTSELPKKSSSCSRESLSDWTRIDLELLPNRNSNKWDPVNMLTGTRFLLLVISMETASSTSRSSFRLALIELFCPIRVTLRERSVFSMPTRITWLPSKTSTNISTATAAASWIALFGRICSKRQMPTVTE